MVVAFARHRSVALLVLCGLASCKPLEPSRQAALSKPLSVASQRELVPRSAAAEAGASVAYDGGLLVVGAERDGNASGATGAVYVFARDQGGTGAWGLLQRIVASDATDGDAFGAAVALSGDVLAVGAPRRTRANVTYAGGVYVFLRSGGTGPFSQAAILTEASPGYSDGFGRQVAVSGDVVAATKLTLSPGTGQGNVLVFGRNQGGTDAFGLVTRLTTCSTATVTDYFGRSLSSSGDLLVAGDLADGSKAGCACIFGRNQGGADAWGLVKKIPLPESLSNTTYGDDFGDAVSISGDVLAVGAWGRNEGGQFRSGAAYVFRRDQGGAGNWGLVRKLLPPSSTADDTFGATIATSGGVVAVSAYGGTSGATYVYEQNRGGADVYGLARTLSTTLATWGAGFGASVAASGTAVAVGAPLADLVAPDSGGAALFAADQGGTGAWGEVVQRGPSGALALDRRRTAGFGSAVAASGGVAIVGGPYYAAANASETGAAWLFGRDQGGTDAFGGVTRLGPRDGGAFLSFVRAGSSVAASGDLAVVGASNADLVGSDSGAAFVFLRDQGGPGSWGWLKTLRAPDATSNQLFGSAVAADGDVVAVGAPNAGTGGKVYVFGRYQGGADAFGHVATIAAADAAAGDRFGRAVALSGDVLVVGAPDDDDGGTSSGSAYVFLRDQGGANAWGQVAKLVASDGAAGDAFGSSVAVSADVVAIGAPLRDEGAQANSGAAYVFLRDRGGADSFASVKKLVPSDAAAYDQFGAGVAAGPGMVAVGAERSGCATASGCGAVYLFGRSSGGVEAFGQVARMTRPAGYAYFYGRALALSGEVIVIGEPQVGDWPGAAWAATLADADDCATNPCQNGGTCIDHVGGYTCTCPPGLSGAVCEIQSDPCLPSPCQNGGTCAVSGGSYTCTCPAGTSGTNCEITPCTSAPCLNGGTCSVEGASFTCACAPGFTGTTCETNVDDCSPNPCQNGGTCTDGVNAFTCTCTAGFAGATCGDDVDECALQTAGCSPDATCTNTVGGYACACNAGFEGDGTTCTARAKESPNGCGCAAPGGGGLDLATLALAGLLLPRWRRRGRIR